MASQWVTDDIVVIDVARSPWNGIELRNIGMVGGSCAIDDEFIAYTDESANIPVAKSYRNTNESQGVQLKATVSTSKSLLKKMAGDAIRITDYNATDAEPFPNQVDTPTIQRQLIAAIKDNLDITMNSYWAQSVAGGILKAVNKARTDSGNNGGESAFSTAVKAAMLESKSPKSNYSSLFDMKDFLCKAYVCFFGLDYNYLQSFWYNFSADLLFSPKIYTTKNGSGKITAEGWSFYSKNEPEYKICTRCLIIYNSTNWQTATPDIPLSFGFKAKDLPKTQYPVYDFIIQNNLLRTFSNNPADEPNWDFLFKQAKAAYLAKQAWKSGRIIFDDQGVATHLKLNFSNSGSGVMEVIFGFNFGEQNGSLWLGNLFATFQINVDNYAKEVNYIQQYMARCRELMRNQQTKILQDSQNVYVPKPAPENKLDLEKPPETDAPYAYRDGVVDIPRDNLPPPTDPPPGSTTQNGGNDTWLAPDSATVTDPNFIP